MVTARRKTEAQIETYTHRVNCLGGVWAIGGNALEEVDEAKCFLPLV